MPLLTNNAVVSMFRQAPQSLRLKEYGQSEPRRARALRQRDDRHVELATFEP